MNSWIDSFTLRLSRFFSMLRLVSFTRSVRWSSPFRIYITHFLRSYACANLQLGDILLGFHARRLLQLGVEFGAFALLVAILVAVATHILVELLGLFLLVHRVLEFLHLFLVHLILFSGGVGVNGVVMSVVNGVVNGVVMSVVNLITITLITITLLLITLLIIIIITLLLIALLLPMHHVRHLRLAPHSRAHLQQHPLVLRAEPARLHAAVQLELVLHVAQLRHLLPSPRRPTPTSRA